MKTTLAAILLYVMALFATNYAHAVPPDHPNHPLHQLKPEMLNKAPIFCYKAGQFYDEVLRPEKYRLMYFEPVRLKEKVIGMRTIFKNSEKSILMVLLLHEAQRACVSPFSTLNKAIGNGRLI